jgi:hypothetical protein
MLEAIGDYGRGLKGPTMYELSGPLLQKRKKKIQEVHLKCMLKMRVHLKCMLEMGQQ